MSFYFKKSFSIFYVILITSLSSSAQDVNILVAKVKAKLDVVNDYTENGCSIY